MIPPRGGSNRRPPKVWQRRARYSAPSLQTKCPDQSQRANLKGQALYARPGSCSPLFFSPQEAGDHRKPGPKMHLLRLVGPLGSIFCSSRACFKNEIEKTSKKIGKSMILASASPPKILPKRLRNRRPKNHAIFETFLIIFFKF